MTKEEFTRRITAVTGTLYRVSCGLLRSEADREDAVQETILRAWERLSGLRQEQYFETWVVRILINQCHSIQRQESRFVDIEEVRREQEAAPEEGRALRDALMSLDEAYRLPVILHYVEGYDIRETAAMLRLPEGTVKSRLHRARKMLRSYLQEVQEV
ncbi:MAG: sigma-70 family RNA polymerase sigma factor [Oscillospiraceae bacterium]|nr:sigma-70 family RNA polymerase sigma factor [Oscillospiraceae bacterium]